MKSSFFSFLRRSFYFKMIVVMFAISVIPLIVLSYISVSVSSNTVQKQVNRLNAQLVNQVVDRIELTMIRFRELSEQYSRNTSIQGALVTPSEQYFEEVVRKRDLISVLSTASAIIGNVEGLLVYSAITDEVFSSTEAPATLDSSPYKPLIEAYLSSGQTGLFLDKHSLPDLRILDSSTYYISRVPFFMYEDLKGVLLISMSNDEYQKQIENIQLGNHGSISLLTEDGQTIATTSKLETQEQNERVHNILEHWKEMKRPTQFAVGTSIVSVKQTSTYDHWIVVSEIPSNELTASTQIIRDTVTYFLLILVLLGALCVVGFGYQLYKPLQAVKRQVDAIKKGNFNARVTHFANNEIGDLGRMLNTMSVRIQDLLGDLRESEDLKRKLEIRALQSQINPHFMYNTLNTIRMFALMKDYDKINMLMGRLVALLRYSMENFEQTVPLEKELDYLTDYVGLLNIRYKCQVHLLFEVEEPLQRMFIPKLSLQPLIENAIFHGILPKKLNEGHITIHAFNDVTAKQIILEIIDDGIGVEDNKLTQLQLHLQREEITESIGLLNVWMRMKLLFGTGAHIELNSDGDGLTIRIALPLETVMIKEEPHEAP
ncbi:histidine kinase [Paenibacillus sp. FSL R10-2734]|uniref:sensor histidine kinase n=1 Tax=Paenibacillus sp. FSL R10-2734 TaxID=2954691 RepID=UPI0030D77571